MIAKVFLTLGLVAAWVCGLIALQWTANSIELPSVAQLLAGFSYGVLGGAVAMRSIVEVWND